MVERLVWGKRKDGRGPSEPGSGEKELLQEPR